MLDIIQAITNEEERRTAEDIWEKYQAHIHKIASNVLKNPYDADDATMDTIRCVVQSIHKFVGLGEKDVVCLITVYAQHAAYKIYNKNKAKLSLIFDAEDYSAIKDSSTGVEDVVISKGDYERAARCLEGMSEIYSHTFILRHYYGYSIPEIMKLTGATEANVKKRLTRAKQMLKELMEKDSHE